MCLNCANLCVNYANLCVNYANLCANYANIRVNLVNVFVNYGNVRVNYGNVRVNYDQKVLYECPLLLGLLSVSIFDLSSFVLLGHVHRTFFLCNLQME
jgi:hypothetical protein